MKRSTFAHITNVSLWETIPRSLVTTFLTLVPVAALFFFGGETLKDFAFAILIGIGVSAFSTIFIAAPFLVAKEQQPVQAAQGARLAGDEEASVGGFKTAPLCARAGARDGPVPAPAPKTAPAAAAVGDGGSTATSASRERRRQRRGGRPHGRPR